MTSPARDARLAAQGKGFTEIAGRGPGWLKMRKPLTNEYSLDAQVGNVGWHYGANLENEVDTAWQTSSGTWDYEVVANSFHSFVRDSVPVAYRYLDVATGHFVEITWNAVEWVNNEGASVNAATFSQITPIITDDVIQWNNVAPGWDVRLEAQTARLAKWVTINSLAALGTPSIGGTNIRLRFRLTIQRSTNLDIYLDGIRWAEGNNTWVETGGNIEFRDATSSQMIFSFNRPSGNDSSFTNHAPIIQRVRRTGNTFYSEIDTPYVWLQAASFPIKIDPTIDPTISATANDASLISTSWSSTYSYPLIGYSYTTNHKSSLFTGISGLNGATVTASHITETDTDANGNSLSAEVKVERASSPTATTSSSDFSGRTLTTAAASWTGVWGEYADVDSPSLNSVLNELLASYNPTAIHVFIRTVGTASSTWRGTYDYSDSSTYCTRLHIEYTLSGTTVEESVTLAKFDGVSIGETVPKQDSITLGIILRVSQPFAQQVYETVTLSNFKGVSSTDQILIQDALTLTKLIAEGNGDLANVIDNTLLAKFKNISTTTNVNVLDATSLAKFNNIFALEIEIISESFVLTRFAGLTSEGARPATEESIILAKFVGQSSINLLNIYDFITLTRSINITIGELLTITELVTLLRAVGETGESLTNEKDVVSLAKFIGFGTSEEREGLNEGISLAYSLGISVFQESISHVSEDANIGRLIGIVSNEQGQVTNAISLNRLTNITSNEQGQVSNTISLNRSMDITLNDQGQVSNTISLNRLSGITASELPFSVRQDISLNRLTGITPNEQGELSNTISLNQLLDITANELPFSISQNVSLNQLMGINGISQCQLNDNLSFSKFINIIVIDETAGHYAEILTLSRSLALSPLQEGPSHVGETISINRLNVLATSEQNKIYNSLLFARSSGITPADQYQINNSLIFARSNGLSLGRQISINENITVSKFGILSTSSQLVLEELLSLSRLGSLAILDSRYLLENVNLERLNDLGLISSPSIFETIELGKINILTIITMLYGFDSIAFDQFKSIIAEPPSLYVYNNGDHAIGVLFRDKRAEVLFRDKRASVLWKDKRGK